jgi:hypothetical protein
VTNFLLDQQPMNLRPTPPDNNGLKEKKSELLATIRPSANFPIWFAYWNPY